MRPGNDSGHTDAHIPPTFDSGREGSVGTDGGSCVVPPTVTADFFVSPVGSDTWSGTAATSDGHGNGPFLTLTRAQTAVRAARQAKPSAPVTVDLRGGTYELASTWQLTASDSGASGARVTYQAYPCEVPVLSGGRQIAPGAWKLVAGSSPPTYQTTIPSDPATASLFVPFEQLWVDGSRVFRPRAGGWGYQTIASSPAPGQTVAGESFVPTDTSLFTAGFDDPDVEVVVFEQWTVSRQRLQSVLANGGITTTAFNDVGNFHGYLTGHRIYFDNVQASLATAGQWYLDKSTMLLSYIAASGEDPTATTAVVYPLLTTLVTANLTSYVTFSGLTFAYSNWTVGAGGYTATQGLWSLPAAVALTDTTNLSFTGCSITHTGAAGLTLDATGASGFSPTAASPYSNELTENTLSDLGGTGVRIGTQKPNSPPSGYGLTTVTQSVHFASNLVTGGGRFIHSAMGVLVGESHDNLIEHNEISDFYQTAIAVGYTFASPGSSNPPVVSYPTSLAIKNTISQNLIHDIGEGVTNDMGGIYLLTSDEGAGTGATIEGNVIYNVVNDPNASYQSGNGIYFDQGTSNVTAENNLVYRVSGGAFDENYGRKNVIHNNIFAYPRNGLFNHDLYESTGLWATFTNNIFLYDKNNASFSVFASAGWCPSSVCTGWVAFSDNLYWNTTTPTAAGVVFKLTSPTGPDDLAWWNTLGEDVGSMVADPQFTTLSDTGYVLAPASPALTDHLFTVFSTSGVGPSSPPPAATPVPAAVTLQVPADAATFF